MNNIFDDIAASTAEALSRLDLEVSAAEIRRLIQLPTKPGFGQFAIPLFGFAKMLRQAPPVIAEKAAELIQCPAGIREIKPVSGFLNFWEKPGTVAAMILPRIMTLKERYAASDEGAGKVVVMDYSHPNIAKPFGVGHLRSTVIGNCLYRVLEKLSYRPVAINHLGDWGTQFGKLIYAYRRWGSEQELSAQPIRALYELYVRFHREAESNPELEEHGRAEFKKLEDGDPDNRALWQRFRDLSLEEFNRIYDRLGVSFDSDAGEAFYNEHLAPLIERLQETGLAGESENALVIELDDPHLPALVVRKADDASLYATRDLAAAEYRQKTYHFDRALYIVGAAQELYFRQLFAALKKMGYSWAENMEHIGFGWVKFGKEIMSTRKGTVVFLDEVIEQAVQRTKDIIAEKNPDLPNVEEVAEQVGTGAVVFSQVAVRRNKDIVFSFADVLNFDGHTGPFLQYNHARLCSLLRKHEGAVETDVDFSRLTEPEEIRLTLLLHEYPRQVGTVAETCEPMSLAAHLIELVDVYSSYYHRVRIITDDSATTRARILLSAAIREVLKDGLYLLGLAAPERM
ncbi:arginine--tRNA ligase [Candidatus Zixiibacteriota bacterium]